MILLTPLVAANNCGAPDTLQRVMIDEDELVIAVMRVNNRPVIDSIDLYSHNSRYFLPISQLGFLLNLPWHFDDVKQRFYSNYEDDDFAASQSALCPYNVKLGPASRQSSGYWYQDDFDTYIDVQTLALLLVGEVDFNEELQQLNFSSIVSTLGISEIKGEQVNTFYNEQDINVYPIVQDTYRISTHPIVNYQLNASTQYQNGKSKHRYQGNINATFDLLGLASEYRFIHNPQRTANFAKFSKNIVSSRSQNTHIGNLQTIEHRSVKYELGDITLLGDELVMSNKQALGLNVYSHSQNERRNFNSIRIEETVLPDWRAILFRNGQFIAETNANKENLIVFEDVSTFIGINRFSIQLFGPQGQEEYRDKVIHVGQNQRQHRQLDFAFSLGDANKSLFNNALSSSNPFDKQVTGTVNYGLTNKLTSEIQWHEIVVTGDDDKMSSVPTRFVSTSLDYANWSSLFRAKYSRSNAFENESGQVQKGQALFVGVTSNISRSFTGNFTARYLDDFESQRHSASQALQQEIRFRVNGRVNIPVKMGVGFNFSEQRFKNKAMSRLLSVNTSQQLLGGTFSNTLQYKHQGNVNSFSHSVFLSHKIGAWQVSHSLTWLPFTRMTINRYSANLRWPQQASAFNETRFTYNHNSSAKFKLSHQFSWRADFLNLQIGGSVDEKGHWNAQVGISGSLYHSSRSNSYQFDRLRGNNVRRIEAHAFIDKDRDGKLSTADQPLPDIQFSGAAEWRKQSTGENGVAQLFTQSDYQSISIDETSLSDPFLSPHHTTQIVSTHAGGINKVYFSLLPVNDFEGKVIAIKDKKEKGLLGITVRLYQVNGEQIWETRTQSDGYYFFTQIPPGKYQVVIDAEHLARLELAQKAETIVVGSPMGDIIDVDAIVLVNNK